MESAVVKEKIRERKDWIRSEKNRTFGEADDDRMLGGGRRYYRGILEVLSNSGITLSRVNTGVLDASVAARLDIPDDRLVGIIPVGAMSGHLAVVRVIAIVTTRRVCSRHVALLGRL